jgi:hypothetical protein
MPDETSDLLTALEQFHKDHPKPWDLDTWDRYHRLLRAYLDGPTPPGQNGARGTEDSSTTCPPPEPQGG